MESKTVKIKNPLFHTLLTLRGNARACCYTEPMWGLSMNLCLPYASVYMLALGIRDIEIGLLTSLGMLSQVLFGLLGGIICDKLGRRKTTAIFDFFAWSLPSIIWMLSQNFWFFLGASILNGTWKVTQISWDCLLVEDVEKEKITKVYSLVMVAGNLSALFAPISSLLVARYSLVTAVRILYANAFIVMTAKIIVLYIFSHETEMGKIRMAENKNKTIFECLKGYSGVLKIITSSKGTIFSLVIAALVGVVALINTTFWQIIVSKKLLAPDVLLPFFPMLKSIMTIIFFFTIIPKLSSALRLKLPLLVGFASYFVGQAILASLPRGGLSLLGGAPLQIGVYALLFVSLVFDGLGGGLLAMLAESLVALHVHKEERSRVMAIQHMMIMLAATPFGWIAGALSSIGRTYPFFLTLALLALGIISTTFYYTRNRE